MIRIDSKRNKFTYNIYHIVKSFYPGEDVEQKVDGEQEALVTLEMPGGSSFSVFPEDVGLPRISDPDERQLQEEKWAVTRSVYRYLENFTGEKLAWGILTGVRPTKLIMQKLEAGISREEILRSFQEEDLVSPEKAQLAYETACREHELLSRLDCEEGFSLYVGIPFCPSVCSYCSFSSSPIDVWRDRVDGYLDALIRELKALGEMAAGRRPDTVYIGGGTPTTLEPEQMDRLLKAVTEYFDLSHTLEFTIEAGRPDSITEEKLRVIRRYPVTRISVNPQTMQQKTLDLVGRKHTVQDLVEAFHMARRLGFDNINMDLIAGLPFETYELFKRSFNKVYRLGADAFQLGFLKVLKGTPIAAMKERYGIVARERAPYEIISNMWMSAGQLVRLKTIENMLNIYYNRGGFSRTMEALADAFGGKPFDLYESLADFYYENGYQHKNRKKEDQYRILRRFIIERTDGPAAADAVTAALEEDLRSALNPEEVKRFLKKGWEI